MIKFTHGKVSLRYAVLLTIFFLLSSCQNSDVPNVETPLDDGRIEIGIRFEPDSFNPYLTQSIDGLMIASRMYPRLFREEPRFENNMPVLTPILVTSFTWDPTGLDLTLNLVPNLTWSDGVPLTSKDFAYSFSLQKDPAVGWIKSDNEFLPQSWQIKDDVTLLVHFATSSPFSLLSLNEGYIVPEHHFSKTPVDQWPKYDWAKELVVFGPYQIETYDPGQRLILAPLAGIVAPTLGFGFVRDKESLYQALLAKEFDLAWPLPNERIVDMKKKLVSLSYDNLTIGFIGWNPIDPTAVTKEAPSGSAELERLKKESPHFIFSDFRVRKAMTLAMNRPSYNKRIWAGEMRVPATPWRAGLPYYSGEKNARDFDQVAAGKLLDEAGWVLRDGLRVKDGRPFKFTVLCLGGSALREQYLLAIREDLSKLGVTMEIELQELGRHMESLGLRHFDAAFGIFRLESRPDLSSLYHSSATYNFYSWTSVDDLLETIGKAATIAEMRDCLAKLEEAFYQDQPITLLYSGKNLVGSSDHGLKGRGFYDDPLFEVQTWRRE